MGRASAPAGVLDGALFRDSRLDALIQLADIAAYVVHKRYGKGDRFGGWFDDIGPKFDAVPGMVVLEAGDGSA